MAALFLQDHRVELAAAQRVGDMPFVPALDQGAAGRSETLGGDRRSLRCADGAQQRGQVVGVGQAVADQQHPVFASGGGGLLCVRGQRGGAQQGCRQQQECSKRHGASIRGQVIPPAYARATGVAHVIGWVAWRDDSGVVGAERVLQPFDPWRGRVAASIDHVEAAGRIGMPWVAEQEGLRGAHQLAALAGIDRGRAAAEHRAGAIADFDEDQRVAIQHDQVELAATRLRVAREQAQAVRL